MVILIHQFFHFGDKWLNCCEIKSSVSPDCGMSCMFVVFSGPKNMFYFGLNFFRWFFSFRKLKYKRMQCNSRTFRRFYTFRSKMLNPILVFNVQPKTFRKNTPLIETIFIFLLNYTLRRKRVYRALIQHRSVLQANTVKTQNKRKSTILSFNCQCFSSFSKMKNRLYSVQLQIVITVSTIVAFQPLKDYQKQKNKKNKFL